MEFQETIRSSSEIKTIKKEAISSSHRGMIHSSKTPSKRRETESEGKKNDSKKSTKTSLDKGKNLIKTTVNRKLKPPMSARNHLMNSKDVSPISQNKIPRNDASTSKKTFYQNVKNKINELQKKITVINMVRKDKNLKTSEQTKSNEESLNSSKTDNLTSTTSDKTKNNEEENLRKAKKNEGVLVKRKIPHGLMSKDAESVERNRRMKSNQTASKPNSTNRKTQSDNSVSKLDLSTVQHPKSRTNNKGDTKPDFRTLNTSPTKKRNFEMKKTGSSISLPRKLEKNLSQKDLPSKSRMVLQTEGDLIQKKQIKNIHHITRTGFDGVAQKKENQDNFFIYKNIDGNITSRYFGVCDGHGVYGHKCSGFLRTQLSLTLNKKLKNNFQNKQINDLITATFQEVNNSLLKDSEINCDFSVLYNQEKLITANVGDSRAVLGRFDKGEWTAVNLTRDHKPTDSDEKERIIKSGGRIFPFKDENGLDLGPQRVWVSDEEIPGLAMSRSFGDKVASTVGVTCVPEIKEYKYHKGDSFFVIASDGLWEFIESKEVVNIVKDYYRKNDVVEAAKFLYEESNKRWMKEEEVVDDITIIVVFFK